MKPKFIKYYMDIAKRTAELSSAKRLRVGAIIVKNDRIVSIGYNGTPSGWTNECEYLEHRIAQEPLLKTKPEVIHAEANAIAKLARSTESGEGAVMFLTHAPCMDCAKQIYTAGIRKVFFDSHYRSTDGVVFLNNCNLEVEQINETLETNSHLQ
jgi:dCMP deaminase